MTDRYRLLNTDCVQGMADHLDADSIDLTVTSIPFGALFAYSNKTEDVGNCSDGIDMEASMFGLHMRFFVAQLARVMKPGCIVAVHIQQLLTTKVQHGFIGRRDFRGAVVELFSKGGFEWAGEVVIGKNPQLIAQRQKLHSLLFVTGYRDARRLAPAVNDYVMIFRLPGDGAPVRALHHPQKNAGGWVTRQEWIRWARGVWDDIRETDVLDGYKSAREDDSEKHVCPLQLEVIRRCVLLYSNPDDLVLDPFIGIGSVGYQALLEGRRAVGFELKESYHRQALANCAKAERDRGERLPARAPDLFSVAGIAVAERPDVPRPVFGVLPYDDASPDDPLLQTVSGASA